MPRTESPLHRSWEMVTTLFDRPPQRSKELTHHLSPISFPSDNFSYIRLTEPDMENLYKEIAYTINHGSDRYDSLVCVLNGGKLGADVLSSAIDQRHLKDRALKFIRLKRYPAGQRPLDKPLVLLDLNDDLTDKKILIVEDVIDGGVSLEEAEKVVTGHHPALVHTCAAFVKPWRTTNPTYHAEETSSWIVFPREEKEFHEFIYYKAQEWSGNNVSDEDVLLRFQFLRFPREFIQKCVSTKPKDES